MKHHYLSLLITAGWLGLTAGLEAQTVVTGQWNFNGGDLSATIGQPLQYLDGPAGLTAAGTQFGLTTSFGIPGMGGLPVPVMRVPGDLDRHIGYVMTHGIVANGGGTKVNQYTFIADVMVATNGPGAAAILQISSLDNTDDGDLFWQANQFGQGGNGFIGTGAFTPGVWHRIVAAYDESAVPPVVTKFVDGIFQDNWTANQGLDNPRRALQPTAIIFADGDQDERREWWVSSIQIRAGKMSDTEIAALGGPSPNKIPTSAQLSDVTVPGDAIVPTSGNSPGSEGAANAIDDQPTKYLNFDTFNAGFTVTPGAGSTIVRGLTLTSANDAPDRNPASYALEGSNPGQPFMTIASGPVPPFPTNAFKQTILFGNTVPYTQYRLVFPTVADPLVANSMQIAEVEFLGVLDVPTPPSITQQPQNATNVAAGSTIVLTVQAGGSAPITYQWRLNGQNIPGETSSTLVLMNVLPANSGSYSVGVANPISAVNSSNALVRVDAPPLAFADDFAAAITLNASSFVGRGDNLGATVETGEPNHVGRPPHSSVWLNWVAPPNPGIVTFSTAGSSFDTLLAAYTGSALNALAVVAGDDDRGGFHTSRIRFNVVPGTLYQIAVGSLLGEQGDIVLSGDFQSTAAVLPIINSQPAGRIVNFGDTANFSVAASGAGLSYQWFFNGTPLPGETLPDLARNNVQLSDLGSYQVEVTSGPLTVDSDRAALQINTGGDNALARDKFADVASDAGGFSPPGLVATKSALSGRARKANVVRGYTGTQAFNSYGAGKDAEEPNHCGVLGGASELFCYTPTNSGRLFINTDGSLFNTVLAVYTGPGDSYATLVPVACDNNSGLDQLDSSLNFNAVAATNYWIFVDDVAGVGGPAVVNYRLETPLRFSAPAFTNGVCFCFKLTGTPGLNASIQMSTNLTSWVYMRTNQLSAASGSFTYTDTNAPASPNRFYRAVYHP